MCIFSISSKKGPKLLDAADRSADIVGAAKLLGFPANPFPIAARMALLFFSYCLPRTITVLSLHGAASG